MIPSTNKGFYLSNSFEGMFPALVMLLVLCSCGRVKNDDSPHGTADYLKEAATIRNAAGRFSSSGQDSSNTYANQMIALGEAHKDPSILVEGKVMKARYELRTSNYPAAMKVALEALQLAKENKLDSYLPRIYSTIGNAYKENEYYEGALDAAEQALIAAKALNDTPKIIGALLEQGMFTHSFSMLKNNDSIKKVSLHLYLDGLKFAQSDPKFESYQIAFLDNLCQYYLLTKDYPKGIYYGEAGARLAKKYDRKRSLTYVLNWLGEIYYRQGHFEKGMRYQDSALQYARELNLTYRVAEILGAKYKSYLISGDTKNALANFVESRAIIDSLQILKNVEQVSHLQVQYETGKKDQEIAMLSAINEQKAKESLAILIGLGIFILLSGFLAFQYRVIKHRNRQIKESFDEINRQSEKLKLLMRELHHRVKNNLQVVSSLLSLQSHHLSDQKALQAVLTGQQRIEAMSLIHRSLYQQDNPNMVNMPEYILGLVNSIVKSFGKRTDEMDLKINVNIPELDVDLAMPLGLIINEWVTNSFKYAFNDTDVPLLHIQLSSSNEIFLEIHDNGPGMSREKWDHPQGSFGVKLIKVLNKQIGGKCEMNNENGTRLFISVPFKQLKIAV